VASFDTHPRDVPSVSVIVPCYRQGHFLADALASVFRQEYGPIEVIVVNDGSPDSDLIEAVIAPYADRVIYVSQENRGLSGARNAGLAVATGEFVVCLDADDRLLPHAVATSAQALRERPRAGLVWGFNRLIDAAGRPIERRDHQPFRDGSYAALLVCNTIGPPVGVMFRRDALLAVGAFATDLRYAEDYECYLRIAHRYESYCHERVIVEYRLHDANMSKNLQGMYRGLVQVLARQEALVRGDPALQRNLHKGRRLVRDLFLIDPRIQGLKQAIRDGRWLHAALVGPLLILRYPHKFARILRNRWRGEPASTPRAAQIGTMGDEAAVNR
jgi:glycosyltransferase involved in cell wall biosynthesis